MLLQRATGNRHRRLVRQHDLVRLMSAPKAAAVAPRKQRVFAANGPCERCEITLAGSK